MLIELCFQLGLPTLRKFTNMLAGLWAGDNDRAAAELLDSRYARQVPARAPIRRAPAVLNPTRVGADGEHIAAAALILGGWSPSIINADGFDIIAVRGAATMRVQVKATKKPFLPSQYQWGCSVGKQKRPLTIADCDVVAFTALDLRRSVFVPVARVCEQITFKLPIARLHEADIEADSLRSVTFAL
ncbi:MAG: hypothetical protein HOJ90_02185 [Alphaproteobacteria bacterium]|nr:hypothetical protein [Alphaproteobacteria bacterium]